MKRTIAPADVFNALSELELDSFRGRLEQELEAYTEIKAGKRKPKKADENGSTQDATGTTEDGDVEMVDNPAKKVKRDGEDQPSVEAGEDDGEETQEDEVEDEEEEEEEDGEEEDVDHGHREDDLEVVEDLDREPGVRKGPFDPDAEDTDEDDGPGSQLRENLGLGSS